MGSILRWEQPTVYGGSTSRSWGTYWRIAKAASSQVPVYLQPTYSLPAAYLQPPCILKCDGTWFKSIRNKLNSTLPGTCSLPTAADLQPTYPRNQIQRVCCAVCGTAAVLPCCYVKSGTKRSAVLRCAMLSSYAMFGTASAYVYVVLSFYNAMSGTEIGCVIVLRLCYR
eukprot:709322-Rhodomonas_salina.4